MDREVSDQFDDLFVTHLCGGLRDVLLLLLDDPSRVLLIVVAGLEESCESSQRILLLDQVLVDLLVLELQRRLLLHR